MDKSIYERLSKSMEKDVAKYEDMMSRIGNDAKSLSTLALQAIAMQLIFNNRILLEINKDKLDG